MWRVRSVISYRVNRSLYNAISIALFADADHFLEVGYRSESGNPGGAYKRKPFFTKEIEGEQNAIVGPTWGSGPAEAAETLFLKLEGEGNQFTAYYGFVDAHTSDDLGEVRWMKLGTHAWVDFEGKLKGDWITLQDGSRKKASGNWINYSIVEE